LKDGVIVHGLLTAGWMAQMLTDWLPSPMALKKFGVSYRAMARPGDTISCQGMITNKYDKDGEHLVDCEIYAENQRGEKCAIGHATASLPTRA
jgi:acyl dehydratase